MAEAVWLPEGTVVKTKLEAGPLAFSVKLPLVAGAKPTDVAVN